MSYYKDLSEEAKKYHDDTRRRRDTTTRRPKPPQFEHPWSGRRTSPYLDLDRGSDSDSSEGDYGHPSRAHYSRDHTAPPQGRRSPPMESFRKETTPKEEPPQSKRGWNPDNHCAGLMRRLTISKGFGPSATPSGDEDPWHTSTIPANRSAFVQAVSVTAMAQAELAAREVWDVTKPRTNRELRDMVRELEITIIINPGESLWSVATSVARAIKERTPITHELLQKRPSKPPTRRKTEDGARKSSSRPSQPKPEHFPPPRRKTSERKY
uniref:Tegument protein VP22 n=1 Tax=Infectious laryngotracheitis virus TaxID=10386 RepID=A0A7M3URL2_ILTV|nr:tegument protein VP22 [Gallid alphaherpesvirus 1]